MVCPYCGSSNTVEEPGTDGYICNSCGLWFAEPIY